MPIPLPTLLQKTLLIVIAVFAFIVGFDIPVLFIIPLFVSVYICSSRLALPPLAQPYRLFGITIVGVCVLIFETLSWFGAYSVCDPAPALLHPQLAYDLIAAVFFYMGGAITWPYMLKRYAFSLRDVFIIHGLFGLTIEQQGRAFLAGFADISQGIVIWLFLVLVYGSSVGVPYVLFNRSFTAQKNLGFVRKYAGTYLFLMITTLGISAISGVLVAVFGGFPEPQNICEKPFW